MQESLALFSTIMTWLLLGLGLAAIVLLGLAASQLPAGRGRALGGVAVMALILVLAGLDLLLPLHASSVWKRLLLPLAAPVLLLAVFRLAFAPATGRLPRWHRRLLLLLTGAALLTAGLLALLDWLSP